MKKTNFKIRLPKNVPFKSGDEEYFFLIQNGAERKMMVQDYVRFYQTPKLYEDLLVKHLNYRSHIVLSALLKSETMKTQQDSSELKILDFAAGSGLMGRELANLDFPSITGLDIIPQAAEAAQRDYPGVYKNYFVEDLTQLSDSSNQLLKSKQFNCMVCCSALGHLPVKAFNIACNLIATYGWIVFNCQKDLWENQKIDEFPWVNNPHIFELRNQHTYIHRHRIDGSPVEYVAFVGIWKGNKDKAEYHYP